MQASCLALSEYHVDKHLRGKSCSSRSQRRKITRRPGHNEYRPCTVRGGLARFTALRSQCTCAAYCQRPDWLPLCAQVSLQDSKTRAQIELPDVTAQVMIKLYKKYAPDKLKLLEPFLPKDKDSE